MNQPDLDLVIQSALDGTLDESGCADLRAILKADPEARALYYDYAALHQALTYRISRFTPVDAAKSLADVRMRLQSRRDRRVAIAVAAAFMIGAIITLKMIFIPEKPVIATDRSAHNTLFQISNYHSDEDSPADATWSGSDRESDPR